MWDVQEITMKVHSNHLIVCSRVLHYLLAALCSYVPTWYFNCIIPGEILYFVCVSLRMSLCVPVRMFVSVCVCSCSPPLFQLIPIRLPLLRYPLVPVSSTSRHSLPSLFFFHSWFLLPNCLVSFLSLLLQFPLCSSSLTPHSRVFSSGSSLPFLPCSTSPLRSRFCLRGK